MKHEQLNTELPNTTPSVVSGVVEFDVFLKRVKKDFMNKSDRWENQRINLNLPEAFAAWLNHEMFNQYQNDFTFNFVPFIPAKFIDGVGDGTGAVVNILMAYLDDAFSNYLPMTETTAICELVNKQNMQQYAVIFKVPKSYSNG